MRSMRSVERDGLAYVGALTFALGLLIASDALEIPLTHGLVGDLSYIWAGPRAAILGYDPYDAASWRSAVDALGTQPFDGPDVYSYPPSVLLLLLPLGLVPLPGVVVAWLVVPLALAAVALRMLLRQMAPGSIFTNAMAAIALVLSEPATVTLRTGQWTNVLLAALCLAVVLVVRARPRVSALATAVLLVKPHLFVLGVPALFLATAASHQRVYASVLGIAAVAPALAVALLHPNWWPAWLSDVPLTRSTEPNITTAWRVLPDVFGPAGIGIAATAVIVAVVAVIAVRRDPGRALAIGLAAGLALAPYMRSYDHLLVIVPLVVATGVLMPVRPRTADVFGALALGAFVVGGWLLLYVVGEARGSESFSWLVPAFTFLAVGVVSRLGPLRPSRSPGSPRP